MDWKLKIQSGWRNDHENSQGKDGENLQFSCGSIANARFKRIANLFATL